MLVPYSFQIQPNLSTRMWVITRLFFLKQRDLLPFIPTLFVPKNNGILVR